MGEKGSPDSIIPNWGAYCQEEELRYMDIDCPYSRPPLIWRNPMQIKEVRVVSLNAKWTDVCSDCFYYLKSTSCCIKSRTRMRRGWVYVDSCKRACPQFKNEDFKRVAQLLSSH